MGLLGTFNYTNNFSIVVYFVMRWPWLNKWKMKENYTSFSFLSNSITPWMTCYNIVSRPLAKYNFSLVTWMLFFQKKKSPLKWLPKPCVNLHAFIKNIIWEQGTYFCLQSEWMPWIGLEWLCHQNQGHILPKVILLPMYPKNAYSTHRFNFFVSQCFLLPP